MDTSNLIKRFSFPADFSAPTELKFEDITAKPLTREDLKADIEAVNSSLEIIRKTRGGSWPSEAVNEDFDFLDLAWHEREFREGSSFAYVVYDNDGQYIGCIYLYPMGIRTKLNEDNNSYDMDASWWVTAKAYEKGYYDKLYKAMQVWLKQFPVDSIFYSNSKIPEVS